MKAGIIGGGWAGLVVAHELCKRGHKCVVHEQNRRLGGLIALGRLGPTPIDAGPHIFHTSHDDVLDWITSLVPCNEITDYNAVTTLTDGHVAAYPPQMADKDFLPIHPGDGEMECKTVKDLICHRYGKQIWKRMYRDYTARMWDEDPSSLPLWSFCNFAPKEIPEKSMVFPDEQTVLYPAMGWADVIGALMESCEDRVEVRVNSRVSWEGLTDQYDVVVDTSPILPGVWIGNTFTATRGILAHDAYVHYFAKPPDDMPGLLRIVDQGKIAGPQGDQCLCFQTTRDGTIVGEECMVSMQDAAYPRPGHDAELEEAWDRLPNNVYPFGRGGLHIYDNMADVVRGAWRLVDHIDRERDAKGYTLILELRDIIGGLA